MKFQILADSSCDLTENDFNHKGIGFKIIPLTIRVGEQDFVDDNQLNPKEMLSAMHAFRGKSLSSCPSPDAYLNEFANAEYTFVVTISQKLSGSFNSAFVAQGSHDHPENIFVIDSKATSGTMALIVEEIARLIEQGLSYKEICQKIIEYRDARTLFFVLQKFDNLVAAGRMSRVAGFIANSLLVRPICRAVDGDIKIAMKLIGPRNAFQKLIKLTNEECKDKTAPIVITHCQDPQDGEYVKQELTKLGFSNIKLAPMRGLCSYYALEKGMILCF